MRASKRCEKYKWCEGYKGSEKMYERVYERIRVYEEGGKGGRLTGIAVEFLLLKSFLQFLSKERPQGNTVGAVLHVAVRRDLWVNRK